MSKRLNYGGGARQQSRMIEDKLRSLKKALLYSYQAGTMIIEQDDSTLEFRCLINPDKLTYDSDKKMLSVPFRDICLSMPRIGKTTEGVVDVPIKCGDTFIWKETNTRWLVTLQYLEELAYFRADIRKCFSYPLEIDGVKYWFSNIGENQQTIEWRMKNLEEWNKINYTRTLYIKRNQDTINYFKRFKIVKLPNINGELEPWEVQAVTPNSVEDILIVHLKEYFNNEFEDLSNKIQEEIQEDHELNEEQVVYPYDKIILTCPYVENALWEIKNKDFGLDMAMDAIVIEKEDTTVTIQLLNGKTGKFDVFYNNKLVKHIVIKAI